MKMLDIGCGMGGMSDGFAAEGFDVTGIDIIDAPNQLGYKHKFIQADICVLNGKDFRGYDVIHASMPCRDFSVLTTLGKSGWNNEGKGKWKDPPNPERGLIPINAYLQFVEDANPKFWIMENVPGVCKFLKEKPRFKGVITRTMKRCFFGNFPDFLMPQALEPNRVKGTWRIDGKNRSWKRAKIPLPCSRAFAKACREALEEKT